MFFASKCYGLFADCDDGLKPCQRKIAIYLPKSYVNAGDHPTRIYTMPQLELAGTFGEEARGELLFSPHQRSKYDIF